MLQLVKSPQIFPRCMQGARIGKNAYLDSLDLSDFDLINIGDDVAINEGATLLGHYFKDGHLHFGEVKLKSFSTEINNTR